MFLKRKKDNISDIAPETGADFIVHNMPVARPQAPKLQSPYQNTGGLLSGQEAPHAPNNSRTIGLIIVASSLVVVIAFAYLSYRFIIRPAKSNQSQTSSIIESEKKVESEEAASSSQSSIDSSEITIPTVVSELATVTPGIIGTEASSSEIVNGGTSAGDQTILPIDSDSDGLYDEEEAILGTLTTGADSDLDGYGDLAEIQKGYDPASTGKLTDNSYLTKFRNASFAYSVLAPKSWSSQSLNNEATAIFSAPDQSLFQISVQENAEGVSILNWYSQSFPDNLVTYDKLISTDYYDGIMGEGSLNFYLTDKMRRYIIVVSYIPADDNRLAYPNIFRLLIDSLVID